VSFNTEYGAPIGETWLELAGVRLTGGIVVGIVSYSGMFSFGVVLKLIDQVRVLCLDTESGMYLDPKLYQVDRFSFGELVVVAGNMPTAE
jgi:hypothetical protein